MNFHTKLNRISYNSNDREWNRDRDRERESEERETEVWQGHRIDRYDIFDTICDLKEDPLWYKQNFYSHLDRILMEYVTIMLKITLRLLRILTV